MFEERTYPVDKALVLNIIWDMAELQHGRRTLEDAHNGRVGYKISMYGIEHEFRFTVTEKGRYCTVRIETKGGPGDPAKRAARQFHLLESMMG